MAVRRVGIPTKLAEVAAALLRPRCRLSLVSRYRYLSAVGVVERRGAPMPVGTVVEEPVANRAAVGVVVAVAAAQKWLAGRLGWWWLAVAVAAVGACTPAAPHEDTGALAVGSLAGKAGQMAAD